MGEIIGLLSDESRQAPVRLRMLCDRFKQAWAAGQRPRIEEARGHSGIKAAGPAAGFWCWSWKLTGSGEQPTPQEYQERFPGCVALVEEVFVEVAIPHDWRARGARAKAAPPLHRSPPGNLRTEPWAYTIL